MVPFWIPIIIRHLIFRVPKKGTIILTWVWVQESCEIVLNVIGNLLGLYTDYVRAMYSLYGFRKDVLPIMQNEMEQNWNMR